MHLVSFHLNAHSIDCAISELSALRQFVLSTPVGTIVTADDDGYDDGTGGDTPPPPSGVMSEMPPSTAFAVPEYDIRGLPWDERIHASTKTKTEKGVWTKRRGVQDAIVAKVEAELIAAGKVHTPPAEAPAAPITVVPAGEGATATIIDPSAMLPGAGAPLPPVAPAAPAAPMVPAAPAAAITFPVLISGIMKSGKPQAEIIETLTALGVNGLGDLNKHPDKFEMIAAVFGIAV